MNYISVDLLYYEVYPAHSNSVEWVVLIHGAGGSLLTWRSQIQFLKNQYNVLALDLRDHGQSKLNSDGISSYTFEIICSDILNVLEKEKIDKAHFVTMSMGSLIIQYLLIHFPQKFISATVAGGIYSIHGPLRIFIASARLLTLFLPYHWMYRAFSWLLMPKKSHQAARRIYVRESAKLSQMAYNRWLGLYEQFYSVVQTFAFHVSSVPLLIVSGDQDYFFYTAAKKFATSTPIVQWLSMSECGHICHLENSNQFNLSMLKFIKMQSPVINNFECKNEFYES